MSAMPAGWTEVSESPRMAVAALPDRVTRSGCRADLKLARRSRQRWAVASGSVLFGFFAFTVVMLELLH